MVGMTGFEPPRRSVAPGGVHSQKKISSKKKIPTQGAGISPDFIRITGFEPPRRSVAPGGVHSQKKISSKKKIPTQSAGILLVLSG
jgi:hypothetical protein